MLPLQTDCCQRFHSAKMGRVPRGRRAVIRLKIREVAQAKQISRTRLSRLADTNYKTINALWNDPYREVTTTTLDKIARALGVPVTDLLEQVPDEESH
jgi:DNA-binding Xre family transcriptional regulator